MGISARVAKLEKQIADLTAKLSEAEREIKQLNSTLDYMDGAVADTQADLALEQLYSRSLEVRNSEMQAEVYHLECDVQAERDDARAWRDECAEVRAEADDLRRKLDALLTIG